MWLSSRYGPETECRIRQIILLFTASGLNKLIDFAIFANKIKYRIIKWVGYGSPSLPQAPRK